ncbi:group II intron reverse transcriptase/maturase [Clostridium sp. Marseille-Q2269]|uniref:group II intron reverse transcriptase/maturase n=1 Tax=Clostridium sp. Marseille-Q2269 TaxID=2942205 RepID=UPI002072ABD0|nr:group II intron reverse transcriptase/maturase [Clostridium sp. Marseille-Q2269]
MKVSKNTQQLQKTKYLGSKAKSKVEPKDKHGVHRVITATTRGETDGLEYGSLERILSRENMQLAYKKVVANKGKSGIDRMTVYELKQFLIDNWITIKENILKGKYKPQAVRRIEIPKPNGGVRLLGIPTVLDRLIQQAIAQELNIIYDEDFSISSYGFRPKKSAHDAIKQAEKYINEGNIWIVDIDLEKFFDKVNHDILIFKLSKKIKDKRVLKLIRAYLASGVMINGVIDRTKQGTPQGGPLSPILSNIILDDLDKELERRGHKFCRYADDCNIYVKSQRAGNRVMESISLFIENKLKLKVNKDKSEVDRPWRRKFLGFSFYWARYTSKLRVSTEAVNRYKDKVRKITSRSKPFTIEERIIKLNLLNRGWINYFAISNCKGIIKNFEIWIKQRIRMCIWEQWKKVKTRYKNLKKLVYTHTQAIKYANTRKGYWRTANSPILQTTLNNEFFKTVGLDSLWAKYMKSDNS